MRAFDIMLCLCCFSCLELGVTMRKRIWKYIEDVSDGIEEAYVHVVH